MASADLRDELLCSICLTTFTDPVTLTCGHNFCRGCIDHFLNTQVRAESLFCPECRDKFYSRPELKRNINLHNAAVRLLSTQPHQEEITGICCTYCVEFLVPAVKSCLLCEASLCDKHLRVHSKSPEHVLTNPSTSLEKRKCSIHNKILEYYCTEDGAFICVSCCLMEEHQGHKMESLEEKLEKKKKEMGKFLQRLATKREQTEQEVQSVEDHRHKAEEKGATEAERVTALFIDIRRRLDDLEKRVLSEISSQEEQLSLSAPIQQLEIMKDELSRKMRHIEELCNIAGPLTFLHDSEISDLSDSEDGGSDEDTDGDTEGHDGGDEDKGGHDGGDEDKGGHDGGDEDKGRHDGGDEDTGGHDKTDNIDGNVITGMLHTGISDIIIHLPTVSPTKTVNKRKRHHSDLSLPSDTQASPVIVSTQDAGREVMPEEEGEQGLMDILLDINTADNNILISEDQKTATWTKIKRNRPKTAKRFQCPQVISSNSFSSGRHYWDMEMSSSGVWKVGMCYSSIDRRGGQSHIGYNNRSWCLWGGEVYCHECSGIHNSEEIPLPHTIISDRVRMCLDYDAGQLSFYELRDADHLYIHTFNANFTEPLHVALYVYDGFIKISGGGTSWEEPSKEENSA